MQLGMQLVVAAVLEEVIAPIIETPGQEKVSPARSVSLEQSPTATTI
jgi:hypothetical protein